MCALESVIHSFLHSLLSTSIIVCLSRIAHGIVVRCSHVFLPYIQHVFLHFAHPDVRSHRFLQHLLSVSQLWHRYHITVKVFNFLQLRSVTMSVHCRSSQRVELPWSPVFSWFCFDCWFVGQWSNIGLPSAAVSYGGPCTCTSVDVRGSIPWYLVSVLNFLFTS